MRFGAAGGPCSRRRSGPAPSPHARTAGGRAGRAAARSAIRRDVGLTGKELAVRAQVAQPTISRIETGQLLPTPDTVERLSAALELDESGHAELDALLVRLRDEVSRLKGGLVGREAANAARLRSARRVMAFQSAMIPALLQTAEYAGCLWLSAGMSMRRMRPRLRRSGWKHKPCCSTLGASSPSSSQKERYVPGPAPPR
ncbi:helix-turn-helix domain-containing protein [Nonomuraea sp. NEAU-L178]|nr:helix-turn-helix domain-containing protein [Nonomuraea aurantiaca]